MIDSPRLLIVDDEKDLCEILQFNLQSEGFQIDVVHSAEAALDMDLTQYNLLLLDVMMGDMSGYKMADIVRKELKLETPIVFLTAKSAENDLLTGFNVGGDDYITKPFSLKEVVARIKAVLKRLQTSTGSMGGLLKVDTLEVDLPRKAVKIDNEDIKLTRKEFDILALLIQRRGKYISRQEILNRIWSEDVIVTERNVDVNIARLRKKIGHYGNSIIGRTGYGYCFE